MIGQRLPDGSDWGSRVPLGAYWRDAHGTWVFVTPNGLFGSLACHDVTVHDDGTITVSPSILTQDHECLYHGYLEHGVWRTV